MPVIKKITVFVSILFTILLMIVLILPEDREIEALNQGNPLKIAGIETDIPVYGNNRPVPLAENIVANGMPIHSVFFYSSDSAFKISNYYRGFWETQGYDPVIFRQVGDLYTVAVYDDNSGIMKNITIIDLGEQRLIVASTSTTDEAILDPDPGLELPLPKSLMPVFYTKTRDYGSGSVVAEYLGKLKYKDAIKKITKSFEDSGWVLKDTFTRNGDATSVVLEFNKKGRVCLVGINSLGEDGVNITVTLKGD